MPSPIKGAPIPIGFWDHPVVVQKNNFIYKSLSNFAVNIAVGCGHACRFCYVPSASTNKLKPQLDKLGVDDPDADWGDYVFLRTWDEEKFRASVRIAEAMKKTDLAADGNRAVMFCTTTDPYQVFRHPDTEERKKLEAAAQQIMRRSLEIIRDESTLNVRILTRSPLARIDFDLFKTLGHRLLFGMSLPTLNNNLSKIYEPKAPAPSVRLATLKDAKTFGIPVYVAMAPTYPECDEADLRATLTAIKELEPYTVFHEPINIRSENVERIAAHARNLGVTLKTGVFATRESWKDYAIEALTKVQEIAKELRLDRNLHLWPDRSLGAAWVVDSFPPAKRTAYRDWLNRSWTRISEWPQPSSELLTQERRLAALVSQAKKGEPWSDKQIAAIDYADALELAHDAVYATLPQWAKAVIEAVLVEFYLELEEVPEHSTLANRRLPGAVAKLVAKLANKPQPTTAHPLDKNALRQEAYAVWLQIRNVKSPASHRLSRPLLEKYNLSKAALGAVYAHFTMGKSPKSDKSPQ